MFVLWLDFQNVFLYLMLRTGMCLILAYDLLCHGLKGVLLSF